MKEIRLADYLDHMQQAATDAFSFVDGLSKDDFLQDKRTQQAVIMSLIIMGEAATKVMDGVMKTSPWNMQMYPGEACAVCATASHMATLKSISMWYGIRCK